MTYPLSIGMTPAYYDEGHWLLRAQLRCLAEQTAKDFDVWLIDPHYHKRKNIVPELAQHYKLNLIHVPYRPNQRIAKIFDCAVFNAIYCYSQSPKIARYSCWRFVRPAWVQTMLTTPVNVDFDFLNIKPPDDARRHTLDGHHTGVWDYGTDVVHWGQVPQNSNAPGAAWSHCSDQGDSGIGSVPENCYGNIMWLRSDWLAINGTDEVFTNSQHYEDLNFCIRAINADQQAMRRPHLMYRLDHEHGNQGGYANHPRDFPFTKPCEKCAPGMPRDAAKRIDTGELDQFCDEGVVVCKKCLLSAPNWEAHEFNQHVRSRRQTRATIIAKYRIGRNLRILADDMDKLSLTEKVEKYNADSWENERYYHKG